MVLCGRLVAPGCPTSIAPADVLGAHPELTGALRLAERTDSQVVVVMAEEERCCRWSAPSRAAGSRCATG